MLSALLEWWIPRLVVFHVNAAYTESHILSTVPKQLCGALVWHEVASLVAQDTC